MNTRFIPAFRRSNYQSDLYQSESPLPPYWKREWYWHLYYWKYSTHKLYILSVLLLYVQEVTMGSGDKLICSEYIQLWKAGYNSNICWDVYSCVCHCKANRWVKQLDFISTTITEEWPSRFLAAIVFRWYYMSKAITESIKHYNWGITSSNSDKQANFFRTRWSFKHAVQKFQNTRVRFTASEWFG